MQIAQLHPVDVTDVIARGGDFLLRIGGTTNSVPAAIDNVRLTVDPIPEPGAALGFGLGSLWVAARCRARSRSRG